jgi:hypothetical protein
VGLFGDCGYWLVVENSSSDSDLVMGPRKYETHVEERKTLWPRKGRGRLCSCGFREREKEIKNFGKICISIK